MSDVQFVQPSTDYDRELEHYETEEDSREAQVPAITGTMPVTPSREQEAIAIAAERSVQLMAEKAVQEALANNLPRIATENIYRTFLLPANQPYRLLYTNYQRKRALIRIVSTTGAAASYCALGGDPSINVAGGQPSANSFPLYLDGTTDISDGRAEAEVFGIRDIWAYATDVMTVAVLEEYA